ncbi:hypothetical protein FAZ15_04390 [Sphingobacterium olei]|uniref:Uncharacterized protein n=1 Tax=Sphingobacterium olei TaxID=2571155 RepID=A0A4U0P7R6_9SPHI|nr:hypothetical protein [Sphingobacterium olei]TJZ63523.1 hypothetical protein FAZ15_04390 [Sphingobacterium olei]
MKVLRYVIIVICLFFVGEIHAQEVKVSSIEDMMKSIDEQSRKSLDNLLNGATSKLILSENRDPVFVWSEEGATKVVKIEDESTFSVLENIKLAQSLSTAEVLVFSWDIRKPISLSNNKLSLFKKLKYIVIKTHDELNETVLKEALKDILPYLEVNKVQVLFDELEQPS